MIKKIAEEKYNDTFWKEFGTNVKLGVIEDHSNRTRLAKLLRFQSSHHESNLTSLDQYVERMKEKQDKIYFMAGASRKEVCKSQRKREGVQYTIGCSYGTINIVNGVFTVNVETPCLCYYCSFSGTNICPIVVWVLVAAATLQLN